MNSTNLLDQVKLKAVDMQLPKEVELIYQFIQNFHTTPKHLLPSQQEMVSPSLFYFKAMLGEVMVGMSTYYKVTPFLAETQKTIVHPDYRSQGLGRKISVTMEEIIRNRGFKKIRSAIYIFNIQMIKIKLDQGYIIEGLHYDHDGPGLHEYGLGKILR